MRHEQDQLPKCGAMRSVEQVFTPDGWDNPSCGTCGDPGWIQPLGEDDPLAGRGDRTPVGGEALSIDVTDGQDGGTA